MTLLVDPPMLFGAGYVLRCGMPDGRSAQLAGLAVSGAVLAASVATYRDAEVMRPVWTRLGGRSGRELILNSWVLRFDVERTSKRRSGTVAALFSSYPLWVVAGVCTAGRRRPPGRDVTRPSWGRRCGYGGAWGPPG